jgi:uncharacterized GH25 family protein
MKRTGSLAVSDVAARVTPNRAAAPNTFSIQITKAGKPVRHASVIAGFAMLDM